MSDFPDPDEEFELMYGDDMDMAYELEDDFPPVNSPLKKSKRSLDFHDPNTKAPSQAQIISPKPLEASPAPITNKENVNSSLSNEINNLNPSPVKSKQTPGQGKQLFNNQTIDLTQPNKRTESDRPTIDLTQPNKRATNETDRPTIDLTQPSNNKRTIDETDFEDFDFPENFESALKRSKSSEDPQVVSLEEQQKETIRRILELRKESHQMLRSGLPKNSVKILSNKNNRAGLSRVFPKWPFVKAVDKEGIGVYIRLDSEDDILDQGSLLAKQYSKGHILSEPLDSLLETARSINQSKEELKRKEEIQNRIRDLNLDEVEEVGGYREELWVEKYRPKNYRQLLSDEGTNRTLLQWLMLWDKAVFKRDLPKHLSHQPVDNQHVKGKTDFKFKKTTNILNQDLDQNDCPVHKVALLCGPPGLGKTTLAHIVARHAGYNVVELNASDDRSPAVFHSTLEAATQMRSVMSRDPKPNCLVLDEIDGSPQASIEVLVKYVTGKTSTNKKKKDKESNNLKRPIICICNDLYVPALRPLRQIAFVLQFPPTSSARLAGRLMEVSKEEHINTDLSAMIALSEKTSNDIRSCLSALSCYQNQTLRLAQVHNANIGLKDMQKPLFSMWGELFQIQDDNKANRRGLPPAKSTEDILSRRLKNILHSVQAMGEYDRLAQGVFENYLNIKVNSDLHSLCQGLEGFCQFDLINRHISSTQDYRLYPYLAYPFVTWHLKFAVRSWPKIVYPSVDYEASQRKLKVSQIVKDVLKGMSVSARAFNQNETFLLDTAPLIMYMLAPPLRPISSALFSSEERTTLASLVDTMIDYNLNYVQIRQEDGNYVFVLDPNIELVCKLSDSGKFPELSYACKQLVSHQISLVKMKRFESRLYQNSAEFDPFSQSSIGFGSQESRESRTETVTTTPKAMKALPNHLQRLTPQSVKKPVVDTVTKDFFGRVVENTAIQNMNKLQTDDIVKSDIWFHFKEGYNNAVRKNVLMKDLL
uniref:Chromosome transmission fidelity protein 18 homolog n=1 Tax=Cacopsylla melanoneura TaxID=428564 RepID=A0A8D8QWV5_9HEMI